MDNLFQIRKSKSSHAFFWVELNQQRKVIRQDPVTHPKLIKALRSAFENGAVDTPEYVGVEY